MISFIIALYNGRDYIKKTIISALKQKNVQLEIIVIDDKSTDDSYDVVSALTKEYKNIRLYKNDKNLGFCKTVNRGIQLAKGEFVVILDQDDLLSENHCNTLLNYFSKDVAMVFTDHYLIDGEGEVFNKEDHCLHRDIVINDFVRINPVPVPGLMIRKETLVKIGGYPENLRYPNYGEYHTWIRIALEGRIIYCESVKAFYRRHNGNMTNSFADKKIQKILLYYFRDCKWQLVIDERTGFILKLKVILSCFRDIVKYAIKGRVC